ncbi:MAG: PIN domain-containing protein [Methanoregula sp.]|nr:PIN domain-containing protein [Methanoregula sp.]
MSGGTDVYLLDTNIFLELLLKQDESASVQALLSNKDPADLHISDLAFHSIGIILYQKHSAHLFSLFVQDLFGEGGITILGLGSEDMQRLEQVAAEFQLDFDDAYQYVVAEKCDLMLVSFDTDFDRTDRNRIIPANI